MTTSYDIGLWRKLTDPDREPTNENDKIPPAMGWKRYRGSHNTLAYFVVLTAAIVLGTLVLLIVTATDFHH
jgi:hypothetical protein